MVDGSSKTWGLKDHRLFLVAQTGLVNNCVNTSFFLLSLNLTSQRCESVRCFFLFTGIHFDKAIFLVWFCSHLPTVLVDCPFIFTVKVYLSFSFVAVFLSLHLSLSSSFRFRCTAFLFSFPFRKCSFFPAFIIQVRIVCNFISLRSSIFLHFFF